MHVGEKAAGNCYCEQSEQYRVIVTVHIQCHLVKAIEKDQSEGLT